VRRSIREDWDVLVVGAGPAGSALAWRLARAGVRVQILDAAAFPRSKPCGDCLSPGATPLLAEMGIAQLLQSYRPAHLVGWRLRTPGNTWFEGRFGADLPGPAFGYAIPRRILDSLLLDAAVTAGACLRERTRVFALDTSNPHAPAVRARSCDGREHTLRARWIVGADGLRSVIARRLGGVRTGRRARLAIVGRLACDEGILAAICTGTEQAGGKTSRELVGQLRLSATGCLGVAPTEPGCVNVTLVLPLRAAASLARAREEFFRNALRGYGLGNLADGGQLTEALQVTGPFQVSPRRRSVPGVLLVGDASGYFDPFTGQGIFQALASARLAARALRTAIERPELDPTFLLRRYETDLRRLAGPPRLVQRAIDATLYRPWAIEPLGRWLAGHSRLVSLLLDVTGDRMSPLSAIAARRLGAALAP